MFGVSYYNFLMLSNMAVQIICFDIMKMFIVLILFLLAQNTINEVLQVASSSDSELDISINTDEEEEETDDQIIERRRRQREQLLKVTI